jgi:hypothetical protein
LLHFGEPNRTKPDPANLYCQKRLNPLDLIIDHQQYWVPLSQQQLAG